MSIQPGPKIAVNAPAQPPQPKYGLHYHPTVHGIPIAIEDTSEKRVVAILKGEAHATMAEARVMTNALNKDASAQQTQISDEAVDAAISVYWRRPMDNEHHTRMRAAITAALKWRS